MEDNDYKSIDNFDRELINSTLHDDFSKYKFMYDDLELDKITDYEKLIYIFDKIEKTTNDEEIKKRYRAMKDDLINHRPESSNDRSSI